MRLEWSTRRFLGAGCEGWVFGVLTANGEEVAVKLGWKFSKNGVSLQRKLARHGLSIPVYKYRKRAYIPAAVRHDMCKHCNPSATFGAYQTPKHDSCICNEAFMSIMIMPLVDHDARAIDSNESYEIENTLRQRAFKALGTWVSDIWEGNMAMWQGQWVIIDPQQ